MLTSPCTIIYHLITCCYCHHLCLQELGTKGKSLVRVRGRLVGVSRESFDLVSVLPATPFLSSNVFILLLALLLQISNSLSSLILGYRFKSVGQQQLCSLNRLEIHKLQHHSISHICFQMSRRASIYAQSTDNSLVISSD